MRQVKSLEDRLKKINFPDASSSDTLPVEIILFLPKYLFMSDDDSNVKIGIWNSATKCWENDPIRSEIEYKKETREIKF